VLNEKNPDSPEPGDPSTPNHAARRALPLAPPSVKLDRLPDRLTDTERPVTVEEAREEYLYIERHARNKERRTPKHKRAVRRYAQLLEADRQLQERYDGLTTVMLTRRVSPMDSADEWLTPWEIEEMLNGGTVRRRVRECLDYRLGNYRFEWVAVTSPTRSAATPHEHIYLWIEDPENSVTTENIHPALEKHLDGCANAYERHHRHRTDGSHGAITVQHSPDLCEQRNDKVAKRVASGDTPARATTRGAQYVASQLAHFPANNYFDPTKPDPPDTLLEGAALAWATPHKWFRAGSGVPEV